MFTLGSCLRRVSLGAPRALRLPYVWHGSSLTLCYCWGAGGKGACAIRHIYLLNVDRLIGVARTSNTLKFDVVRLATHNYFVELMLSCCVSGKSNCKLMMPSFESAPSNLCAPGPCAPGHRGHTAEVFASSSSPRVTRRKAPRRSELRVNSPGGRRRREEFITRQP